ncbi:MAG TPA: hypothetical protein VE621_16860 [Bryobacteraceae bacterium]|nr:hypothetical protein [Bryobacteraceae bacterium]
MKVQFGVALLLLCVSGGALRAASPWVPEAGRTTATFAYVNDDFRQYRPGKLHLTLPAPYGQETYFGFLEYGLGKKLSLDVETGYTKTAFRGNSLDGVTDSTIGLRYQMKTGERWALTLRGAAVIAGSYNLTRVGNWSPGDGASGGLGSVLMGWSLPANFFTFLEAGYRVRTNPVPQDAFGSAGVGSSIKRLTWTAVYNTSRSINGVDIVGTAPRYSAYFQPSQFPATKKVFDAVDLGVSYRVRDDLSVGFNYGKIFHGRNVGLKRIYAASISYTLPFRLPHFR